MTDRLKGCTVIFEKDVRVDDAEAILTAIKMVRGVLDVVPVKSGWEDRMGEIRIRHSLVRELIDIVKPKKEDIK